MAGERGVGGGPPPGTGPSLGQEGSLLVSIRIVYGPGVRETSTVDCCRSNLPPKQARTEKRGHFIAKQNEHNSENKILSFPLSFS